MNRQINTKGVRVISNGHVFHVLGNEIVSLGDLGDIAQATKRRRFVRLAWRKEERKGS